MYVEKFFIKHAYRSKNDFTFADHLTRNGIIHKGAKPYNCDICGKGLFKQVI